LVILPESHADGGLASRGTQFYTRRGLSDKRTQSLLRDKNATCGHMGGLNGNWALTPAQPRQSHQGLQDLGIRATCMLGSLCCSRILVAGDRSKQGLTHRRLWTHPLLSKWARSNPNAQDFPFPTGSWLLFHAATLSPLLRAIQNIEKG
jgi:hypothetical protein